MAKDKEAEEVEGRNEAVEEPTEGAEEMETAKMGDIEIGQNTKDLVVEGFVVSVVAHGGIDRVPSLKTAAEAEAEVAAAAVS